MPQPTQLLQHGFTEEVPNLVMGDLPGGIEDGWLAHFDYKTAGSVIHDHLFTVVLARAPQSVAVAKRVLCHDRDLSDLDESNPESGLELLKMDDRRIELESDAFLKRYSVWVDHDQDELSAWEIFDPKLMAWLTDEAPEDFLRAPERRARVLRAGRDRRGGRAGRPLPRHLPRARQGGRALERRGRREGGTSRRGKPG
jgi:hypothetical protein